MKFTNEDACKELVKLMTANGETLNLSSRSIEAQVENLLPLIANDEMELNDFVGKILPFVKTADANVRFDVSNGIKEYKEKNPIVKVEPTPPTEGNEEMKALLTRLEALESKEKEALKAKQTLETKNGLAAKLKEMGVANEKWVNAIVDNIAITENFDLEGKAKHLLEVYNSMQSEIDPSITPDTPKGVKTYVSDSIKAASSLVKQQSLIG